MQATKKGITRGITICAAILAKKFLKWHWTEVSTVPTATERSLTADALFAALPGQAISPATGPIRFPNDFGKSKKKCIKNGEKGKYIAFFQAFTNTHAPVEVLREKYEEASPRKELSAYPLPRGLTAFPMMSSNIWRNSMKERTCGWNWAFKPSMNGRQTDQQGP